MITLFRMALGFTLILAEFASAGSFDRPPAAYGPLVNESLQEAGSGIHFRLERCSAVPQPNCRFVSPRVWVVVEGRGKPPSIDSIVIAADLLRDDPATAPDAILSDALMVLAATIVTFDPGLRLSQRETLASSLADATLSVGHGEGDGIDAHYTGVFDQGADGLFVITVARKE